MNPDFPDSLMPMTTIGLFDDPITIPEISKHDSGPAEMASGDEPAMIPSGTACCFRAWGAPGAVGGWGS